MKNIIKENIGNPEELEKLYRADNKLFEKAFFEIYPEISGYEISAFWKTRLEADQIKTDIFRTTGKDFLFLLVTCAIAGFLIKIPAIFKTVQDENLFYLKNAGLIVLGCLSLYSFFTGGKFKKGHLVITALVFFVSALYINLLPADMTSNTVFLASLHLPLILWCLYGFVYSGFDIKNKTGRINYIKHNGELAVLLAVIAIAGGILTGVTIGLFQAIGLNAEKVYFDYVVVWGMVSAPVVATFIIRYFPAITSRIPSVIAGIFSPLVLLTLVVYLVVIIFSGKSLYTDREFLLIFNLMLFGVTAIIVFSVSETSLFGRQRFMGAVLLALVVATFITDLIALSAIIYRLGEFGFSPNRTAVVGSNLLILGNLLLVAIDLYHVNFKNGKLNRVETTVANYLPLYAAWAVIVVFLFPFIFGLK